MEEHNTMLESEWPTCRAHSRSEGYIQQHNADYYSTHVLQLSIVLSLLGSSARAMLLAVNLCAGGSVALPNVAPADAGFSRSMQLPQSHRHPLPGAAGGRA